MSKDPPRRLPHAALGVAAREKKAKKIERLLQLDRAERALRILEVGTGSGVIAHHFATQPQGHSVAAVDVVDNRQVADGYRFQLVSGVELPFGANEFEVAISNHVMEHVGDETLQRLHLLELERVLAPGGIAYLAVPNRWMVVEPHYRLVFLSWLPRPLRSPYLRIFRDMPFYDCEPLDAPRLERLLRDTGWQYENLGLEAVAVMRELEPGHAMLDVFDALPHPIKRALLPALPTLIYRLTKPA